MPIKRVHIHDIPPRIYVTIWAFRLASEHERRVTRVQMLLSL